MPYLEPNDRNILADAILDSIGYDNSLRRIFLSDVAPKFRNSLATDFTPRVQLDLDLLELTKYERLTDGTIPLYSWLQNVARYSQTFPEFNKIVQRSIAAIETKSTKKSPLSNDILPSPAAFNNIIKEKIIQQNDMLSYSWLSAGITAGISVARIVVTKYLNEKKSLHPNGSPVISAGTGWLLTSDLIITNYHVIDSRGDNEANAKKSDFLLQGTHTIVEFDFDTDNIIVPGHKIMRVEAFDEKLDYTILRLIEPVDRQIPSRLPQPIFINKDQPQPVNIIQHPFGYAKKLAIRNNHIYDSTYPWLRYFTDTEKGSSGSPVFNDRWQVIALHRASLLIDETTYQGKPSVWINEGILLKAIFDHLESNFTDLNNEILNH